VSIAGRDALTTHDERKDEKVLKMGKKKLTQKTKKRLSHLGMT